MCASKVEHCFVKHASFISHHKTLFLLYSTVKLADWRWIKGSKVILHTLYTLNRSGRSSTRTFHVHWNISELFIKIGLTGKLVRSTHGALHWEDHFPLRITVDFVYSTDRNRSVIQSRIYNKILIIQTLINNIYTFNANWNGPSRIPH